jgi:hypothetical protein
MKPMPSVALATWMLEHVTLGSPNESLSGDLLEEFQSGRTAGWYWRQALTAIAITLSSKSRAYVLPLVFSACWSIVYPALLLSITRSRPTQTTLERMAAHDWPYSSGLHFVGAAFPAIYVRLDWLLPLSGVMQPASPPAIHASDSWKPVDQPQRAFRSNHRTTFKKFRHRRAQRLSGKLQLSSRCTQHSVGFEPVLSPRVRASASATAASKR